MTTEEEKLHNLRRERVARTKRILRWMPRRSNLHRYPVLKWFAKTARQRSYLWSFRLPAALPALYSGFVLAFLPIYGVQLPIAALLAFALRANLPILFSLQFITNPVTVIPVYYTTYNMGRLPLKLVGFDSPALNLRAVGDIIHYFKTGQWALNFEYFGKIWLVTCFGSLIFGLFCATIASWAYRFTAKEIAHSYNQLKELQAKRLKEEQDSE